MAYTKLRNTLALQTTQRILLVSNITYGEDKIGVLFLPVLVVWWLTTIQTRANATAGDTTDSFAMKMAV
jgi:hypothetical protein